MVEIEIVQTLTTNDSAAPKQVAKKNPTGKGKTDSLVLGDFNISPASGMVPPGGVCKINVEYSADVSLHYLQSIFLIIFIYFQKFFIFENKGEI